jgi:hypothetical protein
LEKTAAIRRGRSRVRFVAGHLAGGVIWVPARHAVEYDRVPTDVWSRYAVLVRSVRTPSGPRLKHVAYLGTIAEGGEHHPRSQLDFWDAVDRRLSSVAIPDEERGRITASLESVVPRPPAGTRERLLRLSDEIKAHLARQAARRAAADGA